MHFLGRAGDDDLAAMHAGARTEIDDVIGGEYRFLVVFDDDDRITDVAAGASSVPSSRWLSRWCRPIDGSSRT